MFCPALSFEKQIESNSEVNDDYSDEEIDMDELERRMWRDKMKLKRLKEMGAQDEPNFDVHNQNPNYLNLLNISVERFKEAMPLQQQYHPNKDELITNFDFSLKRKHVIEAVIVINGIIRYECLNIV
ncbi:hypothetical protein CQW23_08714 [Capsicum baccatum]|uniref:Uncharacterized protein n=1 Tax=Capsicum baccatum TaxID=33114 RepID=A0A2G2X9R5_CAPBA|nr:hypothetical protein CQW23_08714 [Capsicum baccatum]